MGLTVAVTGPTGDIGRAFLRALEDVDEVERVVGMARRPFDPADMGLTKVEYLQGDILERDSVEKLVDGADVVVHLAFLIFGRDDSARETNLQGSRNVFEAALQQESQRLIYTSSVAAYGFHDDNPTLLTEDVPTRGTEDNYYSKHKADVERLLENLARAHSRTDVYVFRPCIVAGPTALMLIQKIPYVQIADKLPGTAKKVIGKLPVLRPVVPDPGTPFQLVHEDDVASALVLGVLGRGEPGTYNLAAAGEMSASDLAHALGWYAVPVPNIALDATAKVISTLPYMPAEAKWVHMVRVPVLMDTTRATRDLGWAPQYDAMETLAAAITGAREQGLLPWPDRI